jgi:hypothetical protein
MKKKYIYALYKGDKFITEGTKEEIAKVQGCKVKTISFLGTNVYKKRMAANKYKYKKPNHLILIRIDDN